MASMFAAPAPELIVEEFPDRIERSMRVGDRRQRRLTSAGSSTPGDVATIHDPIGTEHFVMINALLDLSIEPDIVTALRIAEQVRAEASMAARRDVDVLVGAIADDDALVAIAAIHALAAVSTDEVDAVLLGALRHERSWIREHAAWALSARRPQRDAVESLLDLHASGSDLASMIAQRTLTGWTEALGDTTTASILRRLRSVDDIVARRRLVDTLGRTIDRWQRPVLIGFAVDPDEAIDVRIAAVGALAGEHDPHIRPMLLTLANGSSPVATAALLALFDLDSDDGADSAHRTGLRVAQLTLTGELDGRSSHVGAGDTGGIANLLVSVGHALAAHPAVESVLSIGRSSPDGELDSLLLPDTEETRFASVSFGPTGAPPVLAAEWDFRFAIERGVERALARSTPPDLLHLRMADVGTLAAAHVARRLGIPVVFTCGADPHGPIAQRQAAGSLSRDCFGAADSSEHLWFRARMVERLAAQADHLVLFPRLDVDRAIVQAMGIDREYLERNSTMAPEGIDVANIDAATRNTGSWPIADEITDRLPADRRNRPLVVTVGRLHPVKGVTRVVADWLSDATLTADTNLVVVGGDLERPNASECRILDEIALLLDGHPARGGVVLLGAREPAVVAQVLSAAANGSPSGIASGGVYVNGAPKEEFGLAVIEALAAGLPVVAPAAGGPSTYVDDGVTSVLVDGDEHLAPAITRARALHGLVGRAASAREMVEQRYTVDAYAGALVDAYHHVDVLIAVR